MTQYTGKFWCRRPRCSDFDLTAGDQKLFVESQIPFRRSFLLAIIWNIVWFIYFFTSFFLDVFYFTTETRHIWFISFSNWSFILAIVAIFGDTCSRIVFVVCCKDTDKDAEVPCDIMWYQKIQWTLVNVNNVVTIVMTTLYFSLYSIDMSFSNVCKHLMTSVYVILNATFVTAIPVKLFHFYQSTVFIIIYAIFISIYQSQIKFPNIFLVLNWTEPYKAAILLTCVILIGCPVTHFLIYLIFKLRTFLFNKCSIHEQTSLPVAMKRDATATDVILEDGVSSRGAHFIDIKPDAKDDIGLKTNSSVANGDAFKRYDARMFKSETDLRDYRIKNGLYCDFARSSLILHPRSNSLHIAHSVFDDVDKDSQTENGIPENFRRSQIIVVKKCKTCENEPEVESESDDESSRDSDASSDFLSQYITEDILSYL